MPNKDIYNRRSVEFSRPVILGAIVGGILGIVIAMLYKLGILAIPVLVTMFNTVAINEFVLGIVIGAIAGVVIGILIELFDVREKISKSAIRLHEEKLDIYKKRIQTGKVKIHKEIVTEEKIISVPVNREELVIEKDVLNSKDNSIGENKTEVIRIPISEERIDINKHPVKLGEVSVHKNQIKEIHKVTEILKKEIPHIQTKGNVKVIDNDIPNQNNDKL